MKKSYTVKRITAFLLILVLLVLTSCSVETGTSEPSTDRNDEPAVFDIYNETTENIKKSETVYVNMDAAGNVKNITVSDWLHADKSCVYINDVTTLKDFVTTKGNASYISPDGAVTWQAASSDIYYEGTATDNLPVTVNIRYFLDEQEITPEELAGKSGNFRMEVSMVNNISAQFNIEGKTVTMYTPMVTVGGMMLPYENFSNIEITNGMSVGGGSYEAVVLAGAPGLNESLNLSGLDVAGMENISVPDSFTIKATVTDFCLNDVYFAIIPLSSLNLNIGVPESVEDVKNALSEIQNVKKLLAQVDPNGVLSEFLSDSEAIKEMLRVVDKGLTVYNENQKLMSVMSEQLTPENIALLTEFLNSLDTEEMKPMLDLLSNVPALQSTIDSLLKLSTGLEEVMPLIQSFSVALEDPEVAASLENLPETLDTLTELMNYLNENKELLDVMTALMETDNIDKLSDTIDKISEESSNMGTTDVSALSEDAKELLLRAEQWMAFDYKIYTKAPDYMQTSCMFICKTDPIKK